MIDKDKILKVVKLLNLTQSESDGEALNSIRAANRILKAKGVTWEEFFIETVSPKVETPAGSPWGGTGHRPADPQPPPRNPFNDPRGTFGEGFRTTASDPFDYIRQAQRELDERMWESIFTQQMNATRARCGYSEMPHGVGERIREMEQKMRQEMSQTQQEINRRCSENIGKMEEQSPRTPPKSSFFKKMFGGR